MKGYTLTEDEIYTVKYALNNCKPTHWLIKGKVKELLEALSA